MGRMIDADALKEKFPLPPEMWEMRGQQTLWLAREIRETIDLMPTAQPDNDMIHLQKEQAYLQGWEEGRKALKEEIWEDGRDRLD